MHVRFGGFAPGLLGRREHPRALQAGYRHMTAQNRCTVQHGEDSLASIRLPPLRCQLSPHACPAYQPSPNLSGFSYSPTTTLQGQFTSCRGTRSTRHCQPSRHSCPLCSDVLDNRHKIQLLYTEHRRTTQKYRRYGTKDMKIRGRRRAGAS